MPVLTEPSRRRFWYCGGRDGAGHVVGEIVRMDLQSIGRVTTLAIYDESLNAPPTNFVPKRRGMIVTGYKIPCTICGKEFEWHPSLDSLRKMLRYYEVINDGGKETS